MRDPALGRETLAVSIVVTWCSLARAGDPETSSWLCIWHKVPEVSVAVTRRRSVEWMNIGWMLPRPVRT